MKHIIGLMAMLLPVLCGAQSPPVRALTIGDSVPDLTITNIINYKTSTAKLSDFKDKLLILDFMATSCIGCIEKLPRYDSLQAIYKNQLVILIVSYEPQKRVERFFAMNPIGMYSKLPMASEDSVLSKLFPHAYISHEVWIKDGKVKAITGSEYVTANNIKEVYSGIIPSWPIKRDIENFDTRQPFLKINDNNIPYTSLPATKYYSSFFTHMPDLPVGIYKNWDSASNTRKTTIINQTIIELYMRIYGLGSYPNGPFPYSHVLLRTSNPEYFYYNEGKYYKAGWDLKNTYCYDANLPENMPKEIGIKKMIEDVSLYSGTKAVLKDTIVDCLELVKRDKALLELSDEWPNDGKWMPIKNLVTHLNNRYLAIPIINEIQEIEGKSVPVSMEMLNDLPALQKKLSPYGLEFIKRKTVIRALVISEEDPSHFSHSLKLYAK